MIPEFPKTLHLHQVDDSILSSENLFVEEKVDGANCGMALIDGHPVIRNRTHVLWTAVSCSEKDMSKVAIGVKGK